MSLSLRLWLASTLRQWKSQLADQLVGLAAFAIFASLFMYFYSDFLKTSAEDLSAAMQEVLRTSGSVLVGICGIYGFVTLLTNERRAGLTVCRWIDVYERSAKSLYTVDFIWCLFVTMGAAFLIAKPLAPSPGLLSIAIVVAVLGGLIAKTFRRKSSAKEKILNTSQTSISKQIRFGKKDPSATPQDDVILSVAKNLGSTKFRKRDLFDYTSSLSVLAHHRWTLITKRDSQSRFFLKLAFAAVVLSIFTFKKSGIQYQAYLIACAASFFCTCAVLRSLSVDLKTVWVEKTIGVSHDDYIEAWKAVAWRLAVILGIVTSVVSLAAVFIYSVTPADIWLAPLLSMLGPFLAPSLMLQVDGSKFLTNGLIMSLIILFLGTAMMAFAPLMIVPPLIHLSASKYQQGRFYRSH